MSKTDGFVECTCCQYKQQVNMLFVDLNMTSAGFGKDYRIYCTKCKEPIFFNTDDVKNQADLLQDFVEELTTKKHTCIVCGDEIKHIAEIQKERCFDCMKCVECGTELSMAELNDGADICIDCEGDEDFFEDWDEETPTKPLKKKLKKIGPFDHYEDVDLFDDIEEEEIIETKVDPTAPMWKQALQKYGME